MKKVLLGLMLLSTVSFSMDTNVNEVKNASGMSGIEFSSVFKVKNLNNYKTPYRNLEERYSVIDFINQNLVRKLKIDNYDKPWIVNLSANRLVSNDNFRVSNYDLMVGKNLNENWRVGLNFSYADLRKTEKTMFQSNIFSKYSTLDDYTERNVVVSGYFGTSDKLNETEKDHNYWGLFGEYNSSTLLMNEWSWGYYLSTEYRNYKTENEKNQSLNTKFGVNVSKIIFESFSNFDKKVQPKLLVGYGHDFFAKDKYKNLGTDQFADEVFIKLEVPIKVGVIDIVPFGEMKKSIRDSNYETNCGVQFKFSF